MGEEKEEKQEDEKEEDEKERRIRNGGEEDVSFNS